MTSTDWQPGPDSVAIPFDSIHNNYRQFDRFSRVAVARDIYLTCPPSRFGQLSSSRGQKACQEYPACRNIASLSIPRSRLSFTSTTNSLYFNISTHSEFSVASSAARLLASGQNQFCDLKNCSQSCAVPRCSPLWSLCCTEDQLHCLCPDMERYSPCAALLCTSVCTPWAQPLPVHPTALTHARTHTHAHNILHFVDQLIINSW